MSCLQTRGEKGVPPCDPDDPPRGGGPKFPGPGPWDNDRSPVGGVVGRESGPVRWHVERRADRETLEGVVTTATEEGTKVNTEEGRS